LGRRAIGSHRRKSGKTGNFTIPHVRAAAGRDCVNRGFLVGLFGASGIKGFQGRVFSKF